MKNYKSKIQSTEAKKSSKKNKYYLFVKNVMLINFCINDYCKLQAQHKQTNQLAAAKMCALEGEDDLSDFMIEIDILSEFKHPNVVELHEAYFKDGKLWVWYKK